MVVVGIVEIANEAGKNEVEAGKSRNPELEILEIAIACYMAYAAAIIADRLTVSRAQISTKCNRTIVSLLTIRPVTFVK